MSNSSDAASFQFIAGVFDTSQEMQASGRAASLENPSVSLSDPEAWNEAFGAGWKTDAKIPVNKETSIGISTVNQAVRMISGDVSKLPAKVYRRMAGGDRETDRTHPAHRLIRKNGKVNRDVSRLKFVRRLMVSTLLYENGFAWVDRRADGTPVGLYNLLPDRTCVFRHDGQLFVITEIAGELVAYHYDDVLHIEGIVLDGSAGADLVRAARHDLALSIAARGFTSRFFANHAKLGGILQVPPGTSDKARTKVEEAVQARTSANMAFTSLVLRDGYKWFATTVDPQQADVASIDENQARHVARFFNLSPSKLGIKEATASYRSRESDRQEYFDNTLSYWVLGLESEYNIKLLSEAEQDSDSHYIEHTVDALLWADARARWSIYEIGIRNEVLNPNEVRQRENMNRRPGGDEYQNPNTKAKAASGDRSALDDAHRNLVVECVTRMVNRLTIQAEKASRANRLDDWIKTGANEQLATCRQMWSTVAAACQAAGLGRSGQDVPADLIEALVQDLELKHDPPDSVCQQYRDKAPTAFADRYLKRET